MPKIKIYTADTEFSKLVRSLGKWTCVRCGRKHSEGSGSLHNSHYFSRGRWTVRFDFRNCDPLCYPCHQLWGHGDERDHYKAYMVKKLGEGGLKKLTIDAHATGKRDPKLALLYVRALKKELNVK